jgi:hypothetical protein
MTKHQQTVKPEAEAEPEREVEPQAEAEADPSPEQTAVWPPGDATPVVIGTTAPDVVPRVQQADRIPVGGYRRGEGSVPSKLVQPKERIESTEGRLDFVKTMPEGGWPLGAGSWPDPPERDEAGNDKPFDPMRHLQPDLVTTVLADAPAVQEPTAEEDQST